MRILVVHEVDYIEKVIYEVHEFPELLAAEGHDVVFFHFQEGADRTKNNLFREKLIPGRTIPGTIITLVGPQQFGFPLIDRIWSTLSCIPALIKLLRSNRFDVVLNYAVPTYGLQILILSRIFSVPLVQRALDSSHEIRKSIFKWPILLVEKMVYRFTPILSANNAEMQKYCEKLSGRKRPSMVNFPPLDIEHFSGQIPDLTLQRTLGLDPSDKVVTYMGSFFYFSGLPEVLQRFSELVSSDSKFKLLLIGGGEQESVLRTIVHDLGLSSHVIFTGFVSYEELPRYLALSTVAINPLEISRVASVAFPNKVLQYLATGIPVVSTRLEGLVSALDGAEGLVWADSPAEVLEIALEKAQSSPSYAGQRIAFEGLAIKFSPESALLSLKATLALAVGRNL